jgi:hypothetical protein
LLLNVAQIHSCVLTSSDRCSAIPRLSVPPERDSQ